MGRRRNRPEERREGSRVTESLGQGGGRVLATSLLKCPGEGRRGRRQQDGGSWLAAAAPGEVLLRTKRTRRLRKGTSRPPPGSHPAAARAGPHAPRVPRALGTPEASRPERRALCTPFSDTAAPPAGRQAPLSPPLREAGGRERGGRVARSAAPSEQAGPSARDRRPAPSPPPVSWLGDVAVPRSVFWRR